MASIYALKSLAGTTLLDVDDSGNLTVAGSVTSAGAAAGITNLTATGNTALGDAAADTATITGHVDIDSDRTTAGSGLDVDGRINSATAAFSSVDVTAVQLTTARTAGDVNGLKIATTSLAADSNSVVYADLRCAAPTDGGGTVVHTAIVVETGHDAVLDVSGMATGQADIIIGDNLAEALVIREAGNAYLTFTSTNSAELITAAKRIVASAGIDGVVGGTTPAAVTGTTVTASTALVGRLLSDDAVKATVAVADATGGSTDAALTLSLVQADGTTAITTARQAYLFCTATQYSPTIDTSPTFGTATVGSIIASGSGWALVKTSAAGAFACTLTNATDETLYVSAQTPPAGVSLIADSTIVLGSNSDAVTWSA